MQGRLMQHLMTTAKQTTAAAKFEQVLPDTILSMDRPIHNSITHVKQSTAAVKYEQVPPDTIMVCGITASTQANGYTPINVCEHFEQS